MSKKKTSEKSPPKTKARKPDRSLAFKRAFIHTVALEYYRRRGKIRPTAAFLEIDHHTVYKYMEMPEWDDALKAAEGRFNDELTRSTVLTRGVVDRMALEKVLDWMDDPKGIHDGPFCRIIIALLNSLGLSASGPQIGITANANAGSASVTPNGTDAFQVYEAQWLTENREQWGEALTQKVRAYLATSLPVDPTSNVGPTKSE